YLIFFRQVGRYADGLAPELVDSRSGGLEGTGEAVRIVRRRSRGQAYISSSLGECDRHGRTDPPAGASHNSHPISYVHELSSEGPAGSPRQPNHRLVRSGQPCPALKPGRDSVQYTIYEKGRWRKNPRYRVSRDSAARALTGMPTASGPIPRDWSGVR